MADKAVTISARPISPVRITVPRSCRGQHSEPAWTSRCFPIKARALPGGSHKATQTHKDHRSAALSTVTPLLPPCGLLIPGGSSQPSHGLIHSGRLAAVSRSRPRELPPLGRSATSPTASGQAALLRQSRSRLSGGVTPSASPATSSTAKLSQRNRLVAGEAAAFSRSFRVTVQRRR